MPFDGAAARPFAEAAGLADDALDQAADVLAKLAEVDASSIRTVIDRCDLDALAVVCKAAELDKSMFLTFAVLTCGGRDAMSRAAAYGKLYAELSHDTALRTLRFWRIRCESGEALAA